MQPGDKLIPAGRAVVSVFAYPAGKPGKCEVVLDDGRGARFWGRYTKVTVARVDDPAVEAATELSQSALVAAAREAEKLNDNPA